LIITYIPPEREKYPNIIAMSGTKKTVFNNVIFQLRMTKQIGCRT